jgi:methylphosphotriester-DNA--protein-cysteine methyltransferase
MTLNPSPLETSETPHKTTVETDRNNFDLSVSELKKKRLSVREIAKRLGCSPAKVHRSITRTVDRFADEMGLRNLSREEIQSRIFGFAPKALGQIQRLATSARKEEVQLKASADMLDRAGFSPVQKSISVSVIEEMNSDELVEHAKALIAKIRARRVADQAVEVE